MEAMTRWRFLTLGTILLVYSACTVHACIPDATCVTVSLNRTYNGQVSNATSYVATLKIADNSDALDLIYSMRISLNTSSSSASVSARVIQQVSGAREDCMVLPTAWFEHVYVVSFQDFGGFCDLSQPLFFETTVATNSVVPVWFSLLPVAVSKPPESDWPTWKKVIIPIAIIVGSVLFAAFIWALRRHYSVPGHRARTESFWLHPEEQAQARLAAVQAAKKSSAGSKDSSVPLLSADHHAQQHHS